MNADHLQDIVDKAKRDGLDQSQMAILAGQIALTSYDKGRAVGERLGISGGSFWRGRIVAQKGSKEVVAMVAAGEMSITAAFETLDGYAKAKPHSERKDRATRTGVPNNSWTAARIGRHGAEQQTAETLIKAVAPFADLPSATSAAQVIRSRTGRNKARLIQDCRNAMNWLKEFCDEFPID